MKAKAMVLALVLTAVMVMSVPMAMADRGVNSKDSMPIPVKPMAIGDVILYNVTTVDGQPENICYDGDGNVYFTEVTGNNIGKMTSGGIFTEYEIPTEDSQPMGICYGDGNVYFTEVQGNKIGKMTPTGDFTEYSIPTESCYALSICWDDNINCVFFTEQTACKIGKMSVVGDFTEYNISGELPNPKGICWDGNETIYFVHQPSNITKMTENGIMTDYTIPTEASSPKRICYSSYHDCVFITEARNKICKMTPDGDFTEYNTTDITNLDGICTDDSGNVYYTGYNSEYVGMIGNLSSEGEITEMNAGITEIYAMPVEICWDLDGLVYYTMPFFAPPDYHVVSLIGAMEIGEVTQTPPPVPPPVTISNVTITWDTVGDWQRGMGGEPTVLTGEAIPFSVGLECDDGISDVTLYWSFTPSGRSTEARLVESDYNTQDMRLTSGDDTDGQYGTSVGGQGEEGTLTYFIVVNTETDEQVVSPHGAITVSTESTVPTTMNFDYSFLIAIGVVMIIAIIGLYYYRRK